MRLPALFALAALVAAPSALAQQVYKWKDADGVTHYSASPPPKEVTAEKMLLRGGTTSTVPETPAEGDAAAADGTTPPAGDGLSANAMREREAACITAQSNVEKLQNNPFITMDKDGDGSDELLSPEEHDAQLQRARRYAEEVCPRAPAPAAGG
jgi:hypothetical protein